MAEVSLVRWTFALSETPWACQPQPLWSSMVPCSQGLWRDSPIPTPTAPQDPETPDPLHTPHSCRDLVKATTGKTQAFTKKLQSAWHSHCPHREVFWEFTPGAVFNRQLPLPSASPCSDPSRSPTLLAGLLVCSQDTHF